MTAKRVIIVGAGIVGASTALMLQRRGHAVTIVDPQPPGEGASFGNGGCLNGSSIVPMSMPGNVKDVPKWLFEPESPVSIQWRNFPEVAPWLLRYLRSGTPERVTAQAKALRSLLRTTVESMTSLAQEAQAQDLIRHDGHLYVYRSEKGFQKDQGGWSLRRENGVKFEVLDQGALREFDPALSPDLARGVFIEENGHTIDPSKLVKRLVEQAVRNGAIAMSTAITAVALDGQAVRGVQTQTGELIAGDSVVIAMGAHSKALARSMGDRVPLDTERGYHLILAGSNVRPKVPTTDAEGKYLANWMEGGLRLAGTVELGGLHSPPNWSRARMLLNNAQRLLPGLRNGHPEAQISQWMGFRPSMPDSLPVIGRSTKSPNVLYGFGHGHVGMAGAPMTARILAELISDEEPSIDISPFSAQRFK